VISVRRVYQNGDRFVRVAGRWITEADYQPTAIETALEAARAEEEAERAAERDAARALLQPWGEGEEE
jgi:hypothetical protein